MNLKEISPAELRSFREDHTMTQAELAQRIGGSARAVEDWEAGRRQPPNMLRLALAAIRRGLDPWVPVTFDHKAPDRVEVSRIVREHIESRLADRALTCWEIWFQETEELPLAEAMLLGLLLVEGDGYNDIQQISNWDHRPNSGWRTSMVWRPNLGNGIHPTVAFESRHEDSVRRMAVFVDSKRPNERLPARLRVERALVEDGFRVMTFSGEEVLADPEGCVDRITSVISDLAEECLIDAGILQPRQRQQDEIG